jgi:Phage Mu protein F like protein/Protein of unknown function (DUF935)
MNLLQQIRRFFAPKSDLASSRKQPKNMYRHQLTTYSSYMEPSVANWESAHSSAINPQFPKRNALIAIYDKLLLDDEIAHQLRLAQNNLEFREFSVGNAEIDALFYQDWFADFVNLVVEAELYGYSVVEIGMKTKADTLQLVCEPIPHSNLVHTHRQILLRDSDTTGLTIENLTQQGYCFAEIGKPEYLGVLNVIAKSAIRKESALFHWAVRGKKFGMPDVILQTDAEDSGELDERARALKGLGANSWSILPKDDSISYLESHAGAGAHKIYEDFINGRDKSIAKLINGQTAMSNENAFVGSSEAHERTMLAYTQSRMDRIERLVNGQILPILARLGYPTQGLNFQYQKPKKAANKATPKEQQLESNYQEWASDFNIKDLFESAIKRYFDGFDAIADKYLAAYNFSQIWNDVQKPVLKYTDDAKEIQQNIWVFSVFKSYENAIELTDALTDDNGKIRNWRDYRDIASQILEKYNVEYLRTERETALGVANMAQNWKNIEHNFGEKAMLQYLTVGDARVRECHKKLDGVTLPADHEFWKEFYPLNGWRCRCSVKVVEDDATQTPDYYMPTEKEVPPSFRFNAGQNNRLFGEKHAYFTNVDRATSDKIKDWIRENPKPKS